MSADARAAVASELALLYPGDADVGARVGALLDEYAPRLAGGGGGRRVWTQRDCVVITYADAVSRTGESPAHTLGTLLPDLTGDTVPVVHLLPFFPYSSDDGFSVIDYLQVNPDVGTWSDIARLGEHYELMFDAVINHVSVRSAWFQGFLADDPSYRGWFRAVDPDADVTSIVRPRTLPLTYPFETARGVEHIWATFSDDQVDLDYTHPEVTLAVLRVLLEYVARGASVIRLDAVTYLWKELGTSGVHHPKTHAVVRLARAVLDAVAPHVTIITETNVPHAENVAYFGDGHDEAQLVYNFALPPLVLHSFITGSAVELAAWASTLDTGSNETCFFNFLASHDGIGVRGVEGIVDAAAIDALAARVRAHGGFVNERTGADGRPVPYELNINYFDALSAPDADEPVEVAVRRFLTAHAIAMALPGVPGVYWHSLIGSRGWPQGVALSGANRTINRQKLDADALLAELADPQGRRALTLDGLRRLLRIRGEHAAFAPHADADIVALDPRLFAVRRSAGDDRVLAVHNVSDTGVAVPDGVDLITGVRTDRVAPFGTVWIKE